LLGKHGCCYPKGDPETGRERKKGKCDMTSDAWKVAETWPREENHFPFQKAQNTAEDNLPVKFLDDRRPLKPR
jgi:hypothetical protein